MSYTSGFDSLRDEIEVDALPIAGSFPTWLEGTLLRNGPAQFEVGDDAYRHWFDGLAMLHAFQIHGNGTSGKDTSGNGTSGHSTSGHSTSSDGGPRVSYRNRFLESTSRQKAMEEGHISRAEFATDPCRSIFRRVMALFRPRLTDNASINVAKLAGEWVALTETPLPVAFDPETLDTAGVHAYTDDLGAQTTTAHPHIHPETGQTVTYAASFGRQCQYHVCTIDPGTARREVVATLDVDRPSYMHSFAMTEHYAILSEWPITVDPLSLLIDGKPFIENFDWMPERGTRFRVVRLSDGEEVARVDAPAAFGFHHVNAFERGGAIVCDVVTYDDASIIDELYLDRLRSPDPTQTVGTLSRYRLPLQGPTTGSVSIEPEALSDAMLELPRTHDARVEARPYRYVYGIGARDPRAFADQLIKIDVESGESQTWWADGAYPGEPVFVPRPDAAEEDAGVVLSVVLEPDADRSFLLVLDAETLTERARATVPHAIPFGFHGQFLGNRG